MEPPDCAWCDTAIPPERIHGRDGDAYYLCSCCGKVTRVDDRGFAHRAEPRAASDVNGNLIDGDY